MTLSLNLDTEQEAPKTRSKKALFLIPLVALILLAFWGHKTYEASKRSVQREGIARAAIVQMSKDLAGQEVGSSEHRRLFIKFREACDAYRGQWPKTEPTPERPCPK